MAGRGEIAEATFIDTEHIKVLRNGRWQPMFRPINPDRAFSGVSLAESFAEAYAKNYGVDVGLIPCADGGTSLEQWQEGGLLYENALNQARLALRTSTIVGVLWHQGESDCAPYLASNYKVRFEKLMMALRKDLDLQDVPFVLGELGDFLADCTIDLNVKNFRVVNEQIREISRKNAFTGCVSVEGLTANADNLHFNARSLYELGLRYFSVFQSLYQRNGDFIEKESHKICSTMEFL